MTVYIVHAHIVRDRATVIMACLAKLLIAFTLFGSLSASENDDSQILLKKEISVLEMSNEDLKSRFARLEVENAHLKSKVDSIEKEIDAIKSAASRISLLNPETETKVDEAFRKSVPYHPSAPQSAFQARLTHNLGNVGSDQIITFNYASINIGNNYNPSTGIFTCGIAGLYAFYLTLTTFNDQSVQLHFARNGELFHNIYVGNRQFYGSGSTMALIQLNQGDTVFIKSDSQTHSAGDLIDGGYTYFSGFLL